MKMTKKILLGAAVAFVAATFIGCAGFGDVQASGTKMNKTIKLDATGDDVKDGEYKRGFQQVSVSKECYAIASTVTVDVSKDAKGNENSIISTKDKNAVVGLAFDVHKTKNTDNKEAYDFVLVGVKPADGYYYVERYTDVLVEDLKEDMTTNKTTIGGTYTALVTETSGWASKPITIAKDKDGNPTWDIAVSQDTKGTYVVKINGSKVCEYKGKTISEGKEQEKSKDYAAGSVFAYANCPKGTKVKANFKQDKDATLGLYAEIDE